MPRVHPQRSLASERNAADRIRYERRRKGWTLEALAHRLTRAGTPIAPNAIYKIEKGDPPRRITVDELVAFGELFNLDVTEMLLPMNRVLDRETSKLLRRIGADLDGIAKTVDSLVEAMVPLMQLERSKEPSDQALLRRVREMMPRMSIFYPMGDEDVASTPDPISDAWIQLSDAILEYARWRVTNPED